MSKFSRAAARTVLAGLGLWVASAASAATFVGDRTDFRDETIYFAMTTRFYDGDISNNTYCWDGKLNVNDPEWRGDFKGLIEKLDYIKALGFTAVWITPVVENASGLDYHGYHAINFSKVDPRYESTDCKFQDLIDAAHARGMKIILDIVLNHTGNFGEENLCPMFTKDYTQPLSNIDKSLKLHPDTKLPANYYSLQPGLQYAARINLMKNLDGVNHDSQNLWHHVGQNWDWDDYSRVWGQIAGDCVDLNTENPKVSNYLVNCYGKFIEMGVDGFRIDTSGHIARLTFNKSFIPQFEALAEKHKAKRNGGDFFMFGEVCARARQVIYRDGNINCSPFYYTWKETKNYPWDTSETSWNDFVVMEGSHGGHTNAQSVLQQAEDDAGKGNVAQYDSNNAFLNGNTYHTPDYSKYSGFSVIDFPMHWNFGSTREAWSVKYGDNMYNDATYNVVYVDSHDYAPDGAPENQRFAKGQDVWASNLSLMFTFRGIPCIYYGSEVEFKKGCVIDKGPDMALKDSGRAYFGGYITGDVNVTDFATYTGATGNIAATLSHPLALHIQRLNKIRAAIPALRKGQYSTEGCSGGGHDGISFKRRYTDATTDSYVLVTLGGNATFTGVENGTYKDAITGDVKTVTNGTLSATCSGTANLRIYVLDTKKTPAPGKVGEDNMYTYGSAPVSHTQTGYDGAEEAPETTTVKDVAGGGGNIGGGDVTEPEVPVAPSMSEGEQAVFFENSNNWSGTICAFSWSNGTNYFGAWPGTAMTYLGNKIWKITYTGSEVIPTTAGLIFNNNSGSQTGDFAWINGGYYNAGGYVKTIEGAGEIVTPPTPPAPAPGEYSVFFLVGNSGWNTPHVYIWDGSTKYAGEWPGTAMTLVTDNSGLKYNGAPLSASDVVYRYDFTPKDPVDLKVIFNNGSNSSQTADLALVEHGMYTADGQNKVITSVSSVASDDEISVEVVNGKAVVTAPRATTVAATGVEGRVRFFSVSAGRTTLDLPAGFYIIAGRKVLLY